MSDPRPAARLERVLAVGRAFLTVTALVAIYLDPTEPAHHVAVTYAVLLGYATYSLGILAWVHLSGRLAPRHTLVLHGLDILWSALITFISAGLVSPFFLFYLFSAVAAAYRWGFRETLMTVGTVIVIVIAETFVALNGPWTGTWFAEMQLEVYRTVLRIGYLLLTGFLVGYLAEQERNFRAEMSTLAEATRQPRIDLGLGGSVTAVSQVLMRTFDAAAVVVVLREHDNTRTLHWRLDRPSAARAAAAVRFELNPQSQKEWLFEDPGLAWHAHPAEGTAGAFWITQPHAWPLRRVEASLPPAIRESGWFDTVTAVNLGLAGEWSGRMYLFDISRLDSPDRCLHFLESLSTHVSPVFTNLFLLRRLRSQAGADERARVARELHDGSIQALFGIEMQIEALRRDAPTMTPDAIGCELGHVQDLVRREVLELRELMQALRPIDLDTTDQLPSVLASVVERFRRDTGVSARFVTTAGTLAIPAAQALEIVRILQEALVNVRKHSRARNVMVRLTREQASCRLIVEDDGLGFDFEGRLSASELDRRRLGPAVIKERARVVGADLSVDSTPGVGARIELTFPEGVHA